MQKNIGASAAATPEANTEEERDCGCSYSVLPSPIALPAPPFLCGFNILVSLLCVPLTVPCVVPLLCRCVPLARPSFPLLSLVQIGRGACRGRCCRPRPLGIARLPPFVLFPCFSKRWCRNPIRETDAPFPAEKKRLARTHQELLRNLPRPRATRARHKSHQHAKKTKLCLWSLHFPRKTKQEGTVLARVQPERTSDTQLKNNKKPLEAHNDNKTLCLCPPVVALNSVPVKSKPNEQIVCGRGGAPAHALGLRPMLRWGQGKLPSRCPMQHSCQKVWKRGCVSGWNSAPAHALARTNASGALVLQRDARFFAPGSTPARGNRVECISGWNSTPAHALARRPVLRWGHV